MSNYFCLELDTTPPQLEITAPQYTSSDMYNEIIINSNESLSQYQNIYISDETGNKEDLIFFRDAETPNKFTGNVLFDKFTGIVNITAQLKDEVGNLSSLVSNPILVYKRASFIVNIKQNLIQEIKTTIKLLKIVTQFKTNSIKIKNKIRLINFKSKTNSIKTKIIKK